MDNLNEAYTVTQLSNQIKCIIKYSFNNKIIIKGELSNFKISSYHMYATLKDDLSSVNIIFWNYNKNNKDKKIKNGDKVIISGRLDTYAKNSNYQIYGETIELIGVGDIYKKYKQTKKECKELGYFKKKNKKQLPKYISVVGVVTASKGAALKDFIYMLNKYNFDGQVLVKNCQVQGTRCVDSVIKAINKLDKLNCDVIVITRGGGALEDLIGFSDIKVVKSIHDANTCIISAIGHEIDYMLSDYVADIRSPTPSIAGEVLAAHQRSGYDFKKINNQITNLYTFLNNKLEKYNMLLNNYKSIILNEEDIINDFKVSIVNKLEDILKRSIKEYENKIKSIYDEYESNNPEHIINNGYALIFNEQGNLVKDIENIESNKKLKIRFKNIEILINSFSIIDE